MSRLTELLRQARKADEQLGKDLEAEIAALTKRRTFGLVFEQHQPEAVELPGRALRRGDKVRVLPPRGEGKQGDQRLWRVNRVERVDGTRVAHVSELEVEQPEEQSVLVEDVVVVAEFRDRIYPGLVETGRVERGGDKPFHTVINAENYHALEMLTYTHHESVDLIYIDPPYNTGNDAWIYNDRYVDNGDDYRHSKWLAFMQHRLAVAHDLLRPSGFLLVSIDDREQARLKLLLDDVLGADNLMANFVWRTDGNLDNQAVIKTNHEYVLMYAKDASRVLVSPVKDPNLSAASKLFNAEIRNSVVKNGPKNPPSAIVLEPGFPANFAEGKIPARTDKFPHYDEDLQVRDHLLANRVTATTGWANGKLLRTFIAGGYRPVIDSKGQETVFELTTTGTIENVKVRRASQHHILTVLMNMGTVEVAGNQLRAMGVSFPYPKPQSLMQYLVSMCPPEGTVLDFFGGSGSTLEAVVRLNATSNASRRCLLVTNNEVSAVDAQALRKSGHRKGDQAWEECGVHHRVARPRIQALTTGRCLDGSGYGDSVGANVEFFTLTYEDPLSVRHHRAFERVAPMLWLRAGSHGRVIDDLGEDGWDVSEAYGVLENIDQMGDFVARVAEVETVETVFVVTDSDAAFQMTCRDLPARVTAVRLYESYLHNFMINRRAGA